jgi:hypothetical protein
MYFYQCVYCDEFRETEIDIKKHLLSDHYGKIREAVDSKKELLEFFSERFDLA